MKKWNEDMEQAFSDHPEYGKGVMFMDNLSSHCTDSILEKWRQEMDNWHAPRFFPTNVTEFVQPVDRHCGICYKRDVFKSVRAVLLSKFEEAIDMGLIWGEVNGLTPAQKRIIIT